MNSVLPKAVPAAFGETSDNVGETGEGSKQIRKYSVNPLKRKINELEVMTMAKNVSKWPISTKIDKNMAFDPA
ncbi:MAG: hypothetical protein V1736_11275 [Pseudomonadota bacterium]